MPIYHDGKKMKPYRGYRKPVNVYYGDKKVAGWKNSTQTGKNLTFQTTYNDTADVTVKGKTLQKSEWVHKQGVTTQDGIPTPEAPISLISNLPAGTYKTQDWKGDWWEFTLTDDLCGIGDVRDSVEFDRYSHNGFHWGRMGVKVFDGTETEWTVNGLGGQNERFIFSGLMPNAIYDELNVSLTCSHFNSMLAGPAWASLENGIICIDSSGYIRIYRISGITGITIPSQLKAWLASQHSAGTPVTVVYQLDTPTRTPLTFTKNNASTAPECPMEFLTDTPSLEYPAEVFDAGGSVISAKKPEIYSVPNGTTDSFDDETLEFTNRVKKYVLTEGDIEVLYTNSVDVDIIFMKNESIEGIYNFGISDRNATKLMTDKSTPLNNLNPEDINSIWSHYINATSWGIIVPKGNYADLAAAKTALAGTVIYYQLANPLTINPPYTGYSDSVTATIPALRSNADGTVYDEFEVKTGALTKRVSDWVTLDGDWAWARIDGTTNDYKRVYINPFNADALYNKGAVYKYSSEPLIGKSDWASTSVADQFSLYYFNPTNRLAISIGNTDSGWSDAYSPTSDEIKAYFYGWKICNADGTIPYTDGGTKYWKKLVGTEAEIQNSITPTLPTASYAGYTPYKMIYELAEPIEEQYTPVTLPTYYPTTVIEVTNNTPADMDVSATVKVEDEE